jgi:Protein of unknown function (DUF559)
MLRRGGGWGTNQTRAKTAEAFDRCRAAVVICTQTAEASWDALSAASAYRPIFSGFVCHRSKIVVELDGSQHADDAVVQYDAERTAFLNSRGYTVLRFWNSDVLENRGGVIEIIASAAKPPTRPASPGDLPA